MEKKKYTIIANGDEVVFQNETTLLDCLINNNININYHCREGYCGACRCTLKKGEVKEVISPLSFVNEDEILPCCTVPLTNVHLEQE